MTYGGNLGPDDADVYRYPLTLPSVSRILRVTQRHDIYNLENK